MNPHSYQTTLLRISDEGLTQGYFDLLDELISEAYVVHSPFGALNREEVKGFFAALRTALTDFKVVRTQIMVEGNFAATRSVVTGRFEQAAS